MTGRRVQGGVPKKGKDMKLAIALIAALAATPALSQTACAPRDDVVDLLAERHDESPRAAGLVNGGVLLEVWAADNGSWTIFLTDPHGISCMVAAGEDFSMSPAAPDGDPI